MDARGFKGARPRFDLGAPCHEARYGVLHSIANRTRSCEVPRTGSCKYGCISTDAPNLVGTAIDFKNWPTFCMPGVSWTECYAVVASTDTWEKSPAGQASGGGLVLSASVPVVGHHRKVVPFDNFHSLAAGRRHSVAARRDGRVLTAGNGMAGERNVEGWVDVLAVAAGNVHTARNTGRVHTDPGWDGSGIWLERRPSVRRGRLG